MAPRFPWTHYIPVRRLDRYVARQFGIAYLICSSAIIGLFVVLDGVSNLRKFMKQDENLLFVVVQYFAATVPVYFCQYLGPVLALVAAMFAVTLLNKNLELVPMKATGISVHRILAPLFLVAFIIAMLQVGIQEFVLPNSKDFIRQALSYGKRKNHFRVETVIDRENHLKLEVQQYYARDKRGNLASVTLMNTKTMAPRAILQAKDISWSEERHEWTLGDVRATYWKDDGTEDHTYQHELDTFTLDTTLLPIDLESSDQEIPYLSYGELLAQYHRNPLPHLEVKLHQRFAFPLANMILLLIGLPFALRSLQQSVFVGIGIAIVVSAAYMLSTTVFADLGNKGDLPAGAAAWLPVLFFGALGFTWFDGMET